MYNYTYVQLYIVWYRYTSLADYTEAVRSSGVELCAKIVQLPANATQHNPLAVLLSHSKEEHTTTLVHLVSTFNTKHPNTENLIPMKIQRVSPASSRQRPVGHKTHNTRIICNGSTANRPDPLGDLTSAAMARGCQD